VLQKAWRVQNESLWQPYRASLDKVAGQMQRVPANLRQPISLQKPKPLKEPPVHWDGAAFASATGGLPGQLRGDVNEMYLLSGVPSDAALKILMGGFDERFA